MMAMSDWNIVARSLKSRWFSTFLTAMTVAIAAGLMTLLISMRSAGEGAFRRGTGNVEMLISKEPGPLASVLNSLFYAEAPGNSILFSEYQELNDAYPFAWTVPTLLGDSFQGSPVMGTNLDFFESFEPAIGTPWSLAQGRYFDKPFEIVLGSIAASRHDVGLGDSLVLHHGSPRSPGGHDHEEFAYTVVGILKPTGTAHDRAVFTDLTSAWILHAHDRRENQLGEGIETSEADLIDADKKITAIYASLGDRKAALTQILSALRRDPDWTVASPASTVGNLFKIVSNIDEILLAMAIAVMLSSGISILVALYNSMDQRRHQIAVLRVLGASKMRVFSMILTESAMIGALGGSIGILLAIVGGRAVSTILQSRVGVYVEPALPIDGYLMILLATVALSCIAGVIPASIAYRTSVVRSLRPNIS